MTNASYQQFCPVAMAAEILCTRWTVVLLRELIAGSTRFNELRRGVPRMSPALLSKRLGELEQAGIVERARVTGRPEIDAYRLTDSGRDVQAVVEAIGMWGQKWVETEPSLDNLDVELLMWDMRRNLNTQPVPPERTVIEFMYPELPHSRRKWWLIVEPDRTVDLCHIDPGFDVDLYATVDLRTMTEIWMGLRTVANAVDRNRLLLVGPSTLIDNMQNWLGLSPFAKQEKLAS
ncbi:transcriptional regulator, HxlR family [Lutimaribacter pacificus]|uniref:Transcriptional regulator, HxlR family n=1 Tax=Lutimaribacter pacificus TaxID=391948 RepID=A0A1H0EA65_9RHOB|nr:helix-turn-helix domain-containing protein [Lutimaribacter pacificus]SDN79221.1 transcriptional regulator, HxlR family [Lutimaribacter pacificus]SHK54969.1 transcriptional regulator, HxlR family [Lutimaribacter pacificus]